MQTEFLRMSVLHRSLISLLFIMFLPGSPSAEAEQAYRSEKIVIVKSGETLIEIVEREMRSHFYWPSIARYNNIKNPNKLKVGQVVRIPRSFSLSSEAAVVLFVKGDVNRLPATESKKVPVARADRVFVGDEILTGEQGFVSIEFSSGSIININPNSHVSVVDIDCKPSAENCIIELHSDSADVQSRVKQRGDQETQFIIITPSGVAAVRGTNFDLGVSDVQTNTGVVSGQVDVSSLGETSEVGKGFGATVAKGFPPSNPSPLLSAPRLVGVSRRLNDQGLVAWEENSQVQSYQITFSKDKSVNRVISQTRASGTRTNVPQMYNGHYYMTIRAVDEWGIKGWPKTIPITIVSVRSDSAPVLTAEVYDGKAWFSIQNDIPGFQAFEMQISGARSFKDFISVDILKDESASLPISKGVTLWARSRALYGSFEVGEYSEIKSLTNR